MEKYVAESERIRIRMIDEADTDNIIKWRNSKHVMDNFIQRTPLTKEVHLNWLRTKVMSGEVCQFIINEKATGEDIGSVYFRDVDRSKKEGEFGIFIGEKDKTGLGYGIETQRLAMQYAYEVIGLERIKLRVLADNLPAVKTYEKYGFKVIPDEKMDIMIDDKMRTVLFMEAVHS